MARRIGFADVCLDLDDGAGGEARAGPVNEDFSEEILGDLQRGSGVERARQPRHYRGAGGRLPSRSGGPRLTRSMARCAARATSASPSLAPASSWGSMKRSYENPSRSAASTLVPGSR